MRRVRVGVVLVAFAACGAACSGAATASAPAPESDRPEDAATGDASLPADDGGVDAAEEEPFDASALPLAVAGQMFVAQRGTIGDVATSGVQVVLADFAPLCIRGDKSGATRLSLDLASTTGITAGTYSITPVPEPANAKTRVSAVYEVNNYQCLPLEGHYHVAESGTVTVTSVSATTLAGTYDLDFGENGRMRGSFRSDACDLTNAPSKAACE